MYRLKNLSLVLLLNTAVALPTDKLHTAHFEADYVQFNYKAQTGSYRGHLKLRQGSTQISADNAITYFKNNKLDKAILVAKPHHQVYFQTTPEANSAVLKGHADKLVYDAAKNRILFIGNAKVTQGKNSFAAAQMTYQIKTMRIETPRVANKRVVIRLFPDKNIQHNKLLTRQPL